MSENRRTDVRWALQKLGWSSAGVGWSLERSTAMSIRVVWAPSNAVGDSSVSRYDTGRTLYTIGFGGDVPADVIVATCEAAAKGCRRQRAA